MKSCLYFSLVSSVMFSGLAYGACTSAPDCASLGYTAASCPNGGVKCPFDTSKRHCNECGTDYKQDCTGTGYAGGAGTACGGKYAYCNCASGYEWKNGSCQKIPTPVSGRCCNDGTALCGFNQDAYNYCKKYLKYVDCKDMQTACRTLKKQNHVRSCSTNLDGSRNYYHADIDCI